ncbi:hypothetical protein [Roseateles sp.]|uniref:hypothetical protein n=1 Tax=Roseateles sp. TaxID=1971397 RepID=UPI0031D3EB97
MYSTEVRPSFIDSLLPCSFQFVAKEGKRRAQLTPMPWGHSDTAVLPANGCRVNVGDILTRRREGRSRGSFVDIGAAQQGMRGARPKEGTGMRLAFERVFL